MKEIEKFNTGLKPNLNSENINIDPSENIKNKKIITELLKNIADSNKDELKLNITKAYHENAALKCFHPINNINGIDEIYSKIWLPLKNSFADLERRNNIILGGSYQDKLFVSFISH